VAETTLSPASPTDARDSPAGPTRRAVGASVVTALAAAAVWLALALPDRPRDLTPLAALRIPLEGLVLLALALVLRPRPRRVVALASGLLLGLLLVVKVLDLGFFTVFDRRFDLLNDWYYLGPGVGVLGDSIGRPLAVAAALGGALLGLLLVVCVALAVLRVSRAAAARRRTTTRALAALAVVWAITAVTGVAVGSAGPVASRSTAGLAYDQVHQLRADLADRSAFARQIGTDPWAKARGDGLLTALRGKDVVLVFVESYGRVAVEGTSYSPGVDAVLADGTRALRASGYGVRSAFLTSPTFGAGSWLAHSTMQSGLWVDSQQRYNQLLTRQRLTLTGAFGRAGWRTVFDDPAITHDWPEGKRFYGFDQSYDSRNVGYRGPTFGYAPIPDQYSLAALSRNELTADPARPRVMAEIDLVSSHHPWTPLPHLVDWTTLGDGSVFRGMPQQGLSERVAYRDPDTVRALYGQSIEYTMSTLVSWLQVQPDPDLVLVVLGDHQPHSYVSGAHPGHDVPVSVIARDPAVTDQIAGWGWQDDLRPSPDAPVWRMDAFRDRFLAAFSR
jgi:hypothetical protein